MARQPRLAIDRQLHLVLHRAAPGVAIGADAADRQACVEALHTVARDLGVAIHGYAVLPDRLLLLLTPPLAAALPTLMQRLGRRQAGTLRARHGRPGSPWAGRYRAAVLQPQRHLIDAMLWVDAAAVAGGWADRADAWEASSAAHHVGRRIDPLVSDHPAFWSLGNTPFERELAYRRRLQEEPLAPAVERALSAAVQGGWALGDAAFLTELAKAQARPLQPRPRGRPRKGTSSTCHSGTN